MNKLVFITFTMLLLSCNQSVKVNTSHDENQIKTDTLFITEDMFGHFGFDLKYDSLPISRNVWIDVKVACKDTMKHILKHTNLYLESEDSNFQIQRISNFRYKFFINDEYCGFVTDGGTGVKQEYLEVKSKIQPHQGFLLTSYWLNNPISYPEKTDVSTQIEPLEEVKNTVIFYGLSFANQKNIEIYENGILTKSMTVTPKFRYKLNVSDEITIKLLDNNKLFSEWSYKFKSNSKNEFYPIELTKENDSLKSVIIVNSPDDFIVQESTKISI